MKTYTKNSQKAFTLLEILLVIAAIGILAAIVIVAINPQRQLEQVRQSARVSDSRTIQQAVEQYLIDTGSYPEVITDTAQPVCNTGSLTASDSLDPGDFCDGMVDLRSLIPMYLAAIPQNSSASGNDSGFSVYISSETGRSVVLPQQDVVNPIDFAATFTPCGATGAQGPTQGACDTAYEGSDLESIVTITSGIQEWTVPGTGIYRIQARGANGIAASGAQAGASGGQGIIVTADVSLTEGEVIRVLVGQEGLNNGSNGGGGGGTFITREPHNTEESIILIAGGGGGRRTSAIGPGINANDAPEGLANNSNSASSRGTVLENTSVISGYSPTSTTLGQGGPSGNSNYGDGGGGFFGNGNNDGTGPTDGGGRAYVNGGFGGNDPNGAFGGFGGGGSGRGGNGGGGGGGFTGGSGAFTAGGGGSFVVSSATNISYTFDDNVTERVSAGFHGFVEIEYLTN